jgi:carbamoylphosphate synthase large subunit
MAGIYRQRHPEHTVFYRVFFYYLERFLREYENRFEKEYGYFHPVIQDVVEKTLRWRHTGFNVHSQVRAQTTSEAERVGKYMIRPV